MDQAGGSMDLLLFSSDWEPNISVAHVSTWM